MKSCTPGVSIKGLKTVMLVATIQTARSEKKDFGDTAPVAAGKSMRPVMGTFPTDCS